MEIEDFGSLEGLSLEKLIKLRDVQYDDLQDKKQSFYQSQSRLIEIQDKIDCLTVVVPEQES